MGQRPRDGTTLCRQANRRACPGDGHEVSRRPAQRDRGDHCYYSDRLLGLFVLVVTWIPIPSRAAAFPGRFAVLGAVQTYLSLFVGATGPLLSPFLLHRGLPKDGLVVTLGAVMIAIHVLKLLVFAFAGFVFAPYVPLITGMVLAVVLGSWVGTKLRGHLPETALRRILKGLITVLGVRMVLGSLPLT